jgi:integrase
VPAIAHAYRRGGSYSWRRRIPLPLIRFCRSRQLVVSLGTRDPARARFLASQLTAHSDQLFHRAMSEPEPDLIMSRRQLDGIFRESLLAHLEKLDRIAAAERAEPDFDPEASRRADRRMGWILRILGARGAAATIDTPLADEMRRDGLNDLDIEEARATLAAMVRQNGHLMPRARLEGLLANQAVAPTMTNLSLAQEIAFRGMSAAAFATERRYDGLRIEEVTLRDAILLREAQVPPEATGSTATVSTARSQSNADAVPQMPTGVAIVSASPDLALDTTDQEPHQKGMHPIIAFGEAMIAGRARDETWDAKTQHQARQIFALFAKLLVENGLIRVTDLRQSHFAELVDLLRSVSPSYGKSPRDAERSTAELREIGAKLPTNKRGIVGDTINRHLTFLGQLVTFLKAQGLAIDASIDLALLRARKRDRARNRRPSLSNDDVAAIFRLPCFTGCRSWRDPFTTGDQVFHRALYFAIILLYYTGARREEIAGLHVDDVEEASGIAYLAFRFNETRRLKNVQSIRFVALHPEVLRLGFLDYVKAVRALGYGLVFPDLKSPNSSSPLGDRLYDEFSSGLRKAISNEAERKKVIHSFRHSLGNNLKQARVHTEIRADILGHAGSGETDERYCDPTALALMLEELKKVPAVTNHLAQKPIQLLPWVSAKERPPFARARRRSISRG